MATKPPVPDWQLAYRQMWPEMRRPLAGVTAPEWRWGLVTTTTPTATVLPPLPVVVDFAVARGSNY